MRCGRSVAGPPDDPVVVEAAGEVAEGPVKFLDGVEGPEPQEQIFEGSDEPLDASVPFGLPDEGRAGGDTDGLELVLEDARTHRHTARFQDWASLQGVTPSSRLGASSVSPRKNRGPTSVLRRLGQRPRPSAPRSLRRRRRLVPWLLHAVAHCAPSPMRVSQENAPHTDKRLHAEVGLI